MLSANIKKYRVQSMYRSKNKSSSTITKYNNSLCPTCIHVHVHKGKYKIQFKSNSRKIHDSIAQNCKLAHCNWVVTRL